MLRKPCHGWRIKPEIQSLTAIPTLSPRLPLPPLFFYCHCQTQNLPPPTSHFRFADQTTIYPLSTSSLATGPSAAAAAAATYYSPASEPNLNTHFEYPNINVESLRESHDDGREEGFGRTLPDERSSIFTCVSEDGKCKAYVVLTKHSSQELCGEEVEVATYIGPEVFYSKSYPADGSTLEWLKRNPKVVNMLEVHPRDGLRVASEELKKYDGEGDLSEQVANMLEAYLGRGFRVAYEKAMRYCFRVMLLHFPLQVALCTQEPLSAKISLIRGSLMFERFDVVLAGPWKQQANPSRFSCLWRICLLHLLEWIQSGIYFGRKKMRQFRRISFGDGQGRHKR